MIVRLRRVLTGRFVAPVGVAIVLGACSAGAVSPEAASTVPDTTTAAPVTSTTIAPVTTLAPTTTVPAPTATTTSAAPTTTLLPPPDEVVPFESADVLAATLSAAEVALADPATPAGDRNGWAWAQQQAYRDLVGQDDWQQLAREELPEELRPAFDLNVEANELLSELTRPEESLPDWRIETPPPVDELRTHYDAAEDEFGVPWNVLAAVHLVETRFGRIHGTSDAGAQGPMQFLPSTWEAYGEGGDIRDPGDSIDAAARYLVDYGAPGDLPRALFDYDHSDLYVDAVLAYAEAMARYDHYLDVYHRWQVYYRTVDGDVLLPEGWDR